MTPYDSFETFSSDLVLDGLYLKESQECCHPLPLADQSLSAQQYAPYNYNNNNNNISAIVELRSAYDLHVFSRSLHQGVTVRQQGAKTTTQKPTDFYRPNLKIGQSDCPKDHGA